MITVTLQQIKNALTCEDVWKKVLKANGGVNADFDNPFPLASILDSNDLDDTLWVISQVLEMLKHDDVLRKFSLWCALQNIEKIAKYCSNEDYDLIVKWLETGDLYLRESALFAAESAESDAESDARSARSALSAGSAWFTAESARLSARSARSALSAALSARFAAESAESAAESAARSAAGSARSAALSAQKQKLRELLNDA